MNWNLKTLNTYLKEITLRGLCLKSHLSNLKYGFDSNSKQLFSTKKSIICIWILCVVHSKYTYTIESSKVFQIVGFGTQFFMGEILQLGRYQLLLLC